MELPGWQLNRFVRARGWLTITLALVILGPAAVSPRYEASATSRLGSPDVLPGEASSCWTPITNEHAPSARQRHTAIWTGSAMLIWGGNGPTTPAALGDGAGYDPVTDRWRALATNGAPSSRSDHTALWTGSEMLIWGGWGPQTAGRIDRLRDGARYDPVADRWAPIAPAPITPRSESRAVWTGTEMLVWGGLGSRNGEPVYLNDGARYLPAEDRWIPMSTGGTPAGRSQHAAVWTGSEMIIWGGRAERFTAFSDGARYDPATDTWHPLPSRDAPEPRAAQTATWTGSEMLIWGGQPAPRDAVGTGGRYDPATDTWTRMPTAGAPAARYAHTGVWNGAELMIWGGMHEPGNPGPQADAPSPFRPDGAQYTPGRDGWTAIAAEANGPAPRILHTTIWTGSEMLIWGGAGPGVFGDGARYRPG
jgi:N-acetylneuraminic acid mutarotase